MNDYTNVSLVTFIMSTFLVQPMMAIYFVMFHIAATITSVSNSIPIISKYYSYIPNKYFRKIRKDMYSLYYSIQNIKFIDILNQLLLLTRLIYESIFFCIFIRLPFFIFYYIFLFFPIILLKTYMNILTKVASIIRQKSSTARKCYKHRLMIRNLVYKFVMKFLTMTISELVVLLYKTLYELYKKFSKLPSSHSSIKVDKENNKDVHPLTINELSDLLYYEEFDHADFKLWESVDKRMHKVMHHYVPSKSFRATIRLHKSTPITSSSEATLPSYHTFDSLTNKEDNVDYEDQIDTPLSFPVTPLSRAQVLSRSTEKVNSVIFCVRDKLRLGEQLNSTDEYTRQIAMKGLIPSFDPLQTSAGMLLMFGNHCITKKRNSVALCCTSRAIIPIAKDKLTYFEYFITASHDSIPSISLGFSSTDFPLNVMVGSRNCSIGLYSDGQLLCEGVWYQSNSIKQSKPILAGVTVGILVYLSSKNTKSSFIQYSIDGVPLEYKIPSNIFRHFENQDIDIFPSVSILSYGTRVHCRFCEADVIFRSRQMIGLSLYEINKLSSGRVYCLDGSILLI